MNHASVSSALRKAGLAPVSLDPNGVVLRRSGYVAHGVDGWYLAKSPHGVWLEQCWRLERGSGIASQTGTWWLRPLGSAEGDSHGPYRTQAELLPALRRWKRWALWAQSQGDTNVE